MVVVKGGCACVRVVMCLRGCLTKNDITGQTPPTPISPRTSVSSTRDLGRTFPPNRLVGIPAHPHYPTKTAVPSGKPTCCICPDQTAWRRYSQPGANRASLSTHSAGGRFGTVLVGELVCVFMLCNVWVWMLTCVCLRVYVCVCVVTKLQASMQSPVGESSEFVVQTFSRRSIWYCVGWGYAFYLCMGDSGHVCVCACTRV